jgi:hexosaminidase
MPTSPATEAEASPTARTLGDVIPLPALVRSEPGAGCLVMTVFTRSVSDEVRRLAGVLATALDLPLSDGGPGIELVLDPAADTGDEGYRLDVTADAAVLAAREPAGLCRGIQTLRQLAPVDHHDEWTLPGGTIVDRPRYPYRGVMLDVARHFFPVSEVLRYIDAVALYKINHLHLHLTDDQGWRIAIEGWPELTRAGAATSMDNGPGGHYSQDDYRRIVAHAAGHHITVVPEIECPAHANAALVAYPELAPPGITPTHFTDIGSAPHGTLDINNDLTYRFLDEVIEQIAAITPGPYLHVGGDETIETTTADYARFMPRVAEMVARHGKRLLGWAQILTATDPTASTAQFWIYDGTHQRAAEASGEGAALIMSPCVYAYLDLKYAENEQPDTLGTAWAGHLDVRTAYGWDPTEVLPNVHTDAIIGVEAPLWTETVRSLADAEQLTFPRLPAIAEIGWSPAGSKDWDSFSGRLALQGRRWHAAGIRFHRSPQVEWPAEG